MAGVIGLVPTVRISAGRRGLFGHAAASADGARLSIGAGTPCLRRSGDRRGIVTILGIFPCVMRKYMRLFATYRLGVLSYRACDHRDCFASLAMTPQMAVIARSGATKQSRREARWRESSVWFRPLGFLRGGEVSSGTPPRAPRCYESSASTAGCLSRDDPRRAGATDSCEFRAVLTFLISSASGAKCRPKASLLAPSGPATASLLSDWFIGWSTI
jgi:hypothetical protein